jgi:mRNA interferase HigB
MQLLGTGVLAAASRRHANAAPALAAWTAIVRRARWTSIVDLKADMRSADYVAPYIVFNIKGNAYRLMTAVYFSKQTVVARAFLTHAEYDKGMWK